MDLRICNKRYPGKQPKRCQEALFSYHCIGGALWLLLSSHALAADSENQEIIQPDPALIEFLGSFATDDGQWIDPDSLLEPEFAALLDQAAITFGQAASNTENANDEQQDSDND
jgi:hypothetical protein